MALGIMCFALCSCSQKKGSSGPPKAPDQPRASQSLPGGNPRAPIVLNLNKNPVPKPEKDLPKAQKPVQLQQPYETLLPLSRKKGVFPEDFTLGSLQNKYTSDPEKNTVFRSIEEFLSGLIRNEINESLIAADSRPFMVRSLALHKEKSRMPVSFVIGNISIEPGDAEQNPVARANARLYGHSGRAEGEIFLEKISTSWYIIDFQIDLTELDVPYKKKDKPFEPSVYTWLGPQ